jgi:hypothetical protein
MWVVLLLVLALGISPTYIMCLTPLGTSQEHRLLLPPPPPVPHTPRTPLPARCPALALVHAGAPAANSTFFCDANVTTCFSLQPVQTLALHAASCGALGHLWVPGSFAEQVAIETRFNLNGTTYYLGLNRSGLNPWEMVGNGTVLPSPQTLSTYTSPFRFWWHTAETAWAADSALGCVAAIHTQRWCKFFGNEALAADRTNASMFGTGCCTLAHGWSPVNCTASRRAVCVVDAANLRCS